MNCILIILLLLILIVIIVVVVDKITWQNNPSWYPHQQR